jgi:hypothetical protein
MASIAEFERRAAACDRIIRNRAAKVSEAMRQEAPATLAQPGFAPARDVTLQTPMPVPFLPFAEAASDRRSQAARGFVRHRDDGLRCVCHADHSSKPPCYSGPR